MVFYTQWSGICFGDTGILVYHLFFCTTFEAIASSLNLESSWQPRYCFVLLKEMARKGYINYFKPLHFEKRMDLVPSSPK